ncbi:MAG: M20/M25/M40 family metallo-hydrolase [Dehalococcoidia bacterium]|nr:MAG: M20/M25/M40 family metallo-hydrolase [Dehalococcoidia bacterium]
MQQIYEYIDQHWQEAVEDLKRLCRQPSISAQNVGMAEMVPLLVRMMQEYGISTRVLTGPSAGYPLIYGELEGETPITLLFYNHYDVQPPEPLELWTSPPFEPTEYEGNLRARGVSDNKGDIVARLLALKAYQKVHGRPPVSVKFIIEGEEEIGSPNIAAFIDSNQDLLKADACIWECGGVNWRDEPVISLGLKGILCVQLEVRGASKDVHSSMATIVPNPAWRLVWALASLKDVEDNIRIEGFYDKIMPPSRREIDAIDAIPLDEDETKESLGLERFIRDVTGYDYKSRHILEPTCNICGIDSGYIGTGFKTVLPCMASAKLDFRLVPDQRPDDVIAKLRKHLDDHGFSDVVIAPLIEGENPARTSLDSPFVRVVSDAAREVYGLEPVIVPSMAGSGPMYSFTGTLGLPTALIGIMYPGSSPHAPNEHIRLSDFILGSKHVAAVLKRMASV